MSWNLSRDFFLCLVIQFYLFESWYCFSTKKQKRIGIKVPKRTRKKKMFFSTLKPIFIQQATLSAFFAINQISLWAIKQKNFCNKLFRLLVMNLIPKKILLNRQISTIYFDEIIFIHSTDPERVKNFLLIGLFSKYRAFSNCSLLNCN